MPSRRIIPCLDVKDGVVVKGIKFRNHEVIGDVLELARRYRDEGADELVFYDITASSDGRSVDKSWVSRIAEFLDIPFCVAGGIRSLAMARELLNSGCDKISINSPALENPQLITDLAQEFGSQCVVVGVDSRRDESGSHSVFLYTGDENKTIKSKRKTLDWIREAQERGAGEIVLNCMDSDGVGTGYDIEQLKMARQILSIPLVASGGAKTFDHFKSAFMDANVDAGLAAGAFHRREIIIPELKLWLKNQDVEVRI